MVKDERDIALTRNQKLERVRRGNNQTSAVAFELTSSLPLSMKKKNSKIFPFLSLPRGGNGKAEFLKKVADVADGDACAKLCSETGGCQHYK